MIPPFKVIQFKTSEIQLNWNVVSFSKNPIRFFDDPFFVKYHPFDFPNDKCELFELLNCIQNLEVITIVENKHLKSSKFRIKLAETFNSNIKIQEVAESLYTSRIIATREFQFHYGMSPIQYRNKTRVFEALKLIRQGFKITDAIFEVGFNDPSQFNRIFKQIFNIEPNKFKPIQNVTAQLYF